MEQITNLFEGRVSKKSYQVAFLVLFVVGLLVGVLLKHEGMLRSLVSLLMMPFGFGLAARRWHDLGKSGWWSLVFLLPLINLLVMVYLLLADGTKGKNAYGVAPKNKEILDTLLNK
ncbi:hypothetical protein A2368_02420 [Candidatus Collierbacteria bacterium RIFOXYB1_FULL_49_13]|uniref:DUF805 domain-containing protein n=1 Tax=Candidatus Collierbacteria bacterium RIFOXYB1_FULL_49_13 TaxID=1817728 RepID=A0A1F5FB75_9BACT|nr:MAG: hypothetical protein A2368_02420 [Candidatus Collierbacteria bacterium RIFOXYB1_FULL_49_13]